MPPRRPASPRGFRARSRAEWLAWLERHHATEREVWLVYAKTHSGKPTVRYPEAVEEAICFGWIDTTVNRLDADHYVQRFTPRTDFRNWSKLNLVRSYGRRGPDEVQYARANPADRRGTM
jgi:uncharacterized protein YdeI (YjbR/CyaY-like superfamily)